MVRGVKKRKNSNKEHLLYINGTSPNPVDLQGNRISPISTEQLAYKHY